MFPENENQQGQPAGEETAVVVDLTEPLEKQEKPVTAVAGDKAGKQDDKAGDDVVTDVVVDDDDLGDGPKGFKKRLKREIRQKIEARGQAAAATQRAEALEQENAQLRARAERDPEREEAPDTAAIDAKMDTAQAKLEKATEDGDSKTVAAMNRELAELAGQKHAKLAAPKRVQREEQVRQQPARPKGLTPTGKAFIDANGDWWTDPKNAAAKSAIVALDTQLIAEGSDPNSEAHYTRIAKRAKDMGLKVKIRQPFDEDDDMGTDTVVDLDNPDRRERPAPPQGGRGSGQGRVNTEQRDARAGKIVLTEKDKEVMRVFKLDPANPSHLRAFAKSRQERILQEGQQA